MICERLLPTAPLETGTWPIVLDVELALKSQGLHGRARLGQCVVSAAEHAVTLASDLIRPRFIDAVADVDGNGPGVVRLASRSPRRSPFGVRFEGEAIAQALAGARRVIAVVCTIGPALEARVSSLLATDPLLAIALDALGSAACEQLAAAITTDLTRRATAERELVTGPLSPGMTGWTLPDAQRQLFALVDGSRLGVVLTSSGLMIPRKTLSFVVGVGPHVQARTPCPVCEVRDRCKYRPRHD